MNLLPQKIMYKRQRNKLFCKIAAIQAVIFFFTILIVATLEVSIVLLERRISGLDLEIHHERFIESEAAAAAIRNHIARDAAQLEAAAWLELTEFCTKRLDILKETLPLGVELVSADMDNRTASITALTPSLSLSDIHREELMLTGLVYQVQLTSAVLVDGGQMQYRLAVRWKEAE